MPMARMLLMSVRLEIGNYFKVLVIVCALSDEVYQLVFFTSGNFIYINERACSEPAYVLATLHLKWCMQVSYQAFAINY